MACVFLGTLLGRNADELARYQRPAGFRDQGGAVVQPPADSAGPHMTCPQGVYEWVIGASDDVAWQSSEKTPPVKVAT